MRFHSPSFPKHTSVKTLLNGLFDYAGLFPPASLSLPDAIEEYLAHRKESDAWMLGPFVVPVSRLNEVEALSEKFSVQSPVSFDVLPGATRSMDSFAESLKEDLIRCNRFVERMKGKCSVDAIEFRFPPDALSSASQASRSVNAIFDVISAQGYGDVPAFGEIVRSESFAAQLPLYFLALASSRQSGARMFAKIRCGGTDAGDFPTGAELAAFLHTAIRIGHPFKVTAGLHHPLRHFNDAQQVTMHGFVNVFFAVTLGRVHRLDPAALEIILEDENANSFEFNPSGIRWKDLQASNTDLINDRKTLGLSIGSCSFNDPREDLLALGWLTQ